MQKNLVMDLFDIKGEKGKHQDIMSIFKSRHSMASTPINPNTEFKNKHSNKQNGTVSKNNSQEDIGKKGKTMCSKNTVKGAKNTAINTSYKQAKRNLQDQRSMFFSPKMNHSKTPNMIGFDENFKQFMTSNKIDSFGQSHKKKMKNVIESKVNTEVSKGKDVTLTKVNDESKKKQKVLSPNSMKITFSNKSLISKMKKNIKNDESTKQLRKGHYSTINLNARKSVPKVNFNTSTQKDQSPGSIRNNSMKSRKKTLNDMYQTYTKDNDGSGIAISKKVYDNKFADHYYSKNSYKQNTTLTPCNSFDEKLIESKDDCKYETRDFVELKSENCHLKNQKLKVSNRQKNISTKNFFTCKGNKIKDGSSGSKNVTLENGNSRKSLRLNVTQDTNMNSNHIANQKNQSFRKKNQNIYFEEDNINKKNYYLDFSDSASNLGKSKKIKTSRVRVSKDTDGKNEKTVPQSTRSKESQDVEELLNRQEALRDCLGQVQENIRGVMNRFGKEKTENNKLKKFIGMIIKEHDQILNNKNENTH